MISLRVSEEEYSSLMQLYRTHGARSLSDFARLAMVRVAGINGNGGDFVAKLEALNSRVTSLEAQFSSLLERTR